MLRAGYERKRPYINIVYNFKFLKLLEKFVQINYVNSYELLANGILRIYLKNNLDNNFKFKNTRLLFNRSIHTFVPYEHLVVVQKNNTSDTVYILLTDKGLLTQIEAINFKKGGIMICILYF